MIDGLEAEKIGMINHAVEAEELDQAVADFCKRVAQVPLT